MRITWKWFNFYLCFNVNLVKWLDTYALSIVNKCQGLPNTFNLCLMPKIRTKLLQCFLKCLSWQLIWLFLISYIHAINCWWLNVILVYNCCKWKCLCLCSHYWLFCLQIGKYCILVLTWKLIEDSTFFSFVAKATLEFSSSPL